MTRDRFNIAMLVGLLLAAGGLVYLLLATTPAQSQGDRAEVEQRLEQQIAYQARVDFIRRIYAPVEQLRQDQQWTSALLKLKEIAREYPGEPHGLMLKGSILYRQGAIQQALESIAAALKGNGDYVDRNSPLQQRELIKQIAADGRKQLVERLRQQPDNHALERSVKNAYYLESRLAGGCE